MNKKKKRQIIDQMNFNHNLNGYRGYNGNYFTCVNGGWDGLEFWWGKLTYRIR